MRRGCAIGSIFFVVILSGCTAKPVVTASTSITGDPVRGAAIQGRVHGGQQPISGASVYLYAADATGYGKASDSLLNSPGYVTTNGNGDFSITGDYTCPTADTQVYLYAVGGDPTPGVPNSAAGLLAGLGSCGTLASSKPFIFMNEVSTIAAAYSLAGFATDATHIASSGTTLALTDVANAFATIPNLETLGTGAALAMTPSGLAYAPQSQLNTLANILAACINSTGPSSGPCVTVLGSASDTATAAINFAHNPGANVTALYALQTANSPFQPDASPQPADLTLQIAFPNNLNGYGQFNSLAIDGTGNIWLLGGYGKPGDGVGELLAKTLTWSSSTPMTGGGLSTGSPSEVAVDSSENVWVTINPCNGCGTDLVQLNASGTVLSGSSGYTSCGTQMQFADGGSLAIDASGNVWLPTLFANVWEYTGATCWNWYSGGGLNSPNWIAFDTSGNAWIANGVGSVSKFSSSGTVISPSNGYTGGGLNGANGIAVDATGNVWVTNNSIGPSNLSELNSSGAAVTSSSGITTGGICNADNVAIDGAGNVFVVNTGCGGSVSEFTSSGAAITGTNGYGWNNYLGGANDIAIDGSGNVWTTNPGSGIYFSEFVGLASPVVTPLSANLTSPYGSHAVNKP